MIKAVAVLGVWLASASVVQAQSVPDQPVILKPIVVDGRAIAQGGGIAKIVGLKKTGGDGFVSVRGAPTLNGAERGRLTAGRTVIALFGDDAARKTGFIGVLYIDPEANIEVDLEKACGFENPIPPTMTTQRTYTGPCKSGWVARRFVEVLAD